MAFSIKNFLILFLFTLLSSKHIYARGSRFFSKIPRTSSDFITKTSINENSKTLEEEAKEIEKQVLGPLYIEKDSTFIPENEGDRPLGLYDQRDEKLASLDNQENIVGKSYLLDNEKVNDYTEKNVVTSDDVYRPYLPNNYNAKSYVTVSQGYHGNSGKDGYNYGGNRYNDEDLKATEKHGMSDTKFLEGGKYFYDINLEKNGGNNGRRFGYKNEVNNNGGYFDNQEYIPNEYKFEYNNQGQGEDFKFDNELA